MSGEIDYVREYDNSARVANADDLLEKYIADAADFRENCGLTVDYDLSYGPEPRNQMDIFWPTKARDEPIVLFIHGGYWQRLDRSTFSHLAKGLVENGIAVAVPSYTLCPDIAIHGIINEMRRACLVLYQTHKKRLTVVGHSAGGHLAGCMMATDWDAIHPELPNDLVAAGMGISGIYDLLPILQTPVNDAVRLDEPQAKTNSPIHWLPEALQRFEAWVGGTESGEYHRQSRELAAKWTLLGTPTNYVSVKGKNHFTVVEQLTKADGAMVKTIVDLVRNPRIEFNVEQAGDEVSKEERPEAENAVAASETEANTPSTDETTESKNDKPQVEASDDKADEAAKNAEPLAKEQKQPAKKTAPRRRTPAKATTTKQSAKKSPAKKPAKSKSVRSSPKKPKQKNKSEQKSTRGTEDA